MNQTSANPVRRPFTPTNVRRILAMVSTFGLTQGKGPVGETLRVEMITALVTLTGRDDAKRHMVTRFLFGKDSTKELTAGEAAALVAWCGCRKGEKGWAVSPEAAREAKAIVRTVKR